MTDVKITLGLCAALFAGTVYADESAEFTAVRDAIKGLVPNITIDSVRAAPFEGFAEVLLGAQLVYVSLDGEFLIDGQLIEVATRRNLSEVAKGAVRKAKLDDLDGDDLITFAADDKPQHKLYVFTDIDCGYCRRLHAQMDEYNQLGIEVNYLMFPRAGVGSHSFDKAVSVWCADNRNEALTSAKAGEEPEAATCSNPIEMHYELGKELGVTGTPALVTVDGTLLPGYVPPASLLTRLDSLSIDSE